MASEFAVSEVFSHKKSHSGTSSLAVPLQSSDQLGDHDDAYSEGRSSSKKKILEASPEKRYLYDQELSLCSSRLNNGIWVDASCSSGSSW